MAKALLSLVAVCLFLSQACAAAPKRTAPIWNDLTAEEQLVLAPLERDWDRLDSQRRRKWLGIAQRYPTMSADEKSKIDRRMQPWASLSADQRRIARERYKKLEQLPSAKRDELRTQWEAYSRLPEDERARLRTAPPKSQQHKTAQKQAKNPAPAPETGPQPQSGPDAPPSPEIKSAN